MATKKVSYKNLLKQAISEFDTSKTVEVKGPMLDPILSWDGDGELPVYKDAASILERYYFEEDQDDQVTIDDLQDVTEMEYNEDGTEAKTAAEKHGEGTGTEQAGTANASNIRGMEKEQEKDIAKEMLDVFTEDDDKDEDDEDKKGEDKEEEEMEEALAMFFSEQEDEEGGEEGGEEDKDLDVDKGVEEGVVSEKEWDDKDVPEKKEYTDESDDVTEDIENAVIEKLIDEMEDVDEAEVMSYTGDDVKPGMNAPQEKKAKGPEEDTEGAGTEQAGTGTDAGQVPPRKDMADQMVKPKNYSSEQAPPPSAVPGGPGPDKSDSDSDEDDGYNEENADLAEAFEIFKEAIEEDEDASDEDLKV